MTDLLMIFEKYRNAKIALYGLSKETEKVLSELGEEYQIIGLLDGYREDGEIYGKTIVSMNQVIESKVELIIVVARPGSCRVIANRIGEMCRANKIDLYDVRGNDLNSINKVTYSLEKIEGVTRNQLKQLINNQEVISFDIFDTLVMRRTLFSNDVFEMMERKLKGQGVYIKDFAKIRLRSEQELSQTGAPTLLQIYQHMKINEELECVDCEKFAELEWMLDKSLLVPRKEMVDMLQAASEEGKKIYFVSDTYYTGKQLKAFLEEIGIKCVGEILASCDYGKSKTQGLFEVLHGKIGNQSCLHIGDDIVADIESAKRSGFLTCHIFSGIELFEKVGYFGLLDNNQSLKNRIKIGMLVACLFNTPFHFECIGHKIRISDCYNLGYTIFAPIISDFVLWLDKKLQSYKIKNMWFCARDGYLIKQLYDELKRETFSTYFLTSRIAAIRAGVMNLEDIYYISDMGFSESNENMIKERFGIEVSNNTDYVENILEKAQRSREGYKKYISDLKMDDGEIGFFDFVSSGTSQMFLGRFVKNPLKGFYFLKLNEDCEEKKKLDICSFYETAEAKQECAIFEEYYILENILTSPMPSMKEFDEHGKPHYFVEKRSEQELRCVQEIQRGICDYFKLYIKNQEFIENTEDKVIDEKILKLIHVLEIGDDTFSKLELEDIFFHRVTKMEDLV